MVYKSSLRHGHLSRSTLSKSTLMRSTLTRSIFPRSTHAYHNKCFASSLEEGPVSRSYMSSVPTLKHFVKKMTAISFSPLPFVRTTWLAVQQEAPQSLTWMSWCRTLTPHGCTGSSSVTNGTTSTSRGHAPTTMLMGGIRG